MYAHFNKNLVAFLLNKRKVPNINNTKKTIINRSRSWRFSNNIEPKKPNINNRIKSNILSNTTLEAHSPMDLLFVFLFKKKIFDKSPIFPGVIAPKNEAAILDLKILFKK